MFKPEDFIKDQFPQSYWPTIPTILRTAYKAADDMVRDDPILQIESAKDNKGRFISFAVDFFIQRAIDTGAINCDYRWVSFARPTGRYLEMRFLHSTASVSQVVNPNKQPRNVVFRKNARLNNQSVFDLLEFQDEQRIIGLPHFLLIHGHKTLDFAHIGLPSPSSKTGYLWRSQNLMQMPHEIHDTRPKVEDTDIVLDDLELIKEEFKRWSRDNGDE